MKFFKKITTTLLLSASIVTTLSVAALAGITYPEGVTLNAGIKRPGNGYEMGYSYYYHGSKSHASSITHDGKVVADSGRYAKGYTSMANGPSVQEGKFNIEAYYRFC